MKLRRLILLITILSAILLLATTALAQDAADDGKSTPVDSYPLPAQPGAMRYTLADRWDRTDLTFYIHNCPTNIDCNTAHNAVRNAFDTWSSVSALTFTEVSSAGSADIELLWSATEEDFGRPGDTLAFAFFPSYGGDVFFDDAEPWGEYSGTPENMYVIALHEIGHALGLDHTDDVSAVMYAYSGSALDLAPDDIRGIQQLYGANTGGSDGGGETTNTTDTTGTTLVEVVVEVDLPDEVPSGAIEVVDGNLDDRKYFEEWIIDAVAGETITFTMETTNGDLDPYLMLFTPDHEIMLAEDDDGGGGYNSRLTYTFAATGDYYIITTRYGSIDGDSSGNYRLTAERGGVGAVPVQPTPIPDQPVAPTGTVELTVNNVSGATVCYIFISPNTDTTWGSDWLDSDQMVPDQQSVTFDVSPGIYDIRMADCDEGSVEQYYIEIQQDTTINVHEGQFVIDNQPVASTEVVELTVSNVSGATICYIFISPTTDDTWGSDWLDSEQVVPDQQSVTFDVSPGIYDIRIADCSDGSVEQYNIEIQQDTTINAYADRFVIE